MIAKTGRKKIMNSRSTKSAKGIRRGIKSRGRLAIISSTLFFASIITTPTSSGCFGFSPSPIHLQHVVAIPKSPQCIVEPTCRIINRNLHSTKTITGGVEPRQIDHSSIGTTSLTQMRASASFAADDNDGNYNVESRRQRPEWALPWMPTWLITLPPRYQFVVGLCLYIFHLRILTQHQLTFPFQLIPNDEGWFQSIGLDSLAGMVAFGALLWLRKSSVEYAASTSSSKRRGEEGVDGFTSIIPAAVPPIWTDPRGSEAPWRLRSRTKKYRRKKLENNDLDNNVDKKAKVVPVVHPRTTSVVAFVLLTIGYFSTGRLSLLFENLLYASAGAGLPLTVPMHRSLVVLLGHLAWVGVGSAILAGVLSPRPFFGGGWTTAMTLKQNNGQRAIMDERRQYKRMPKMLRPYRWYTNKWDTYWLWWAIGGYFVSAWLFNIADFINQIILPPYLFAQQGEGVVAQLINPENNDFFASLVGYIAPCLSAPWWEEVLYRGYLLPALGLFMGFWPSVFVSGVLFSVHHLNIMGALPLMVLGWLWAALYAKCGNILVTILIHGMWNSRVFIGSWLGL